MTKFTETDNAAANDNAAREVMAYKGESVSTAITAMRNGQATIVSSIVGDDFDTKLTVVDAITTSESLDDNLGKVIKLKNFVIQSIQMVNEQTGVLEDVPRTILIAEDGSAYHAISKGVFSALENIVGIMGEPASWERAIPLHAAKLPAKVGKVMVLRMGAPKTK